MDGRREPQVRIVGQQRLAGARARARDDPVVGGAAADHVVDRSRCAACRCAAVLAPEGIELRPARAAAARASSSSRGIRSSISAEVEALRGERQPHHLVVEVGAESCSAIILAVTRLSARRHGSGSCRSSRNSGGSRGSSSPVLRVDEGVDAARVGLEACARLGRERRQRALGMAVEVERAQEHVGGERALAENLRQAALAGAARQLHLPQAILGVQEARARRRDRRSSSAKMCGTPSRSRTTSTGAESPAIASAPEGEGTVFLRSDIAASRRSRTSARTPATAIAPT